MHFESIVCRARIPRIMQTARLGLEARCTRVASAVIKRDVYYCDRECGVQPVQGFPPRSLGEDSGAMP